MTFDKSIDSVQLKSEIQMDSLKRIPPRGTGVIKAQLHHRVVCVGEETF